MSSFHGQRVAQGWLRVAQGWLSIHWLHYLVKIFHGLFTLLVYNMASALQGHTECRTKVCVVCYKKGKRNISSSELSFIQSHLIEGYTSDNLDFPCALCDHCHAVLNERINNDCAIFSTTQIASYDPE